MSLQGNLQEYMIGQELGKGEFGTTYLATGEDGGKYAIKYFKDTNQAKHNRDFEEGILKLITNVCKNYATCFVESIENDQGMFIVMDFVEGTDMLNIMFNPKLIELKDRRPLGYQVMKDLILAVHNIHSMGLAHQDIKPANVMYNVATGKSKLIDFGLACVLSKSLDVTGTQVFQVYQTWPCGTYGTPITAPPEMIEDLHTPDPQSDLDLYSAEYIIAHDIWSIGCVILDWYTVSDSNKDQYPWYAEEFHTKRGYFDRLFKDLKQNEPEAYNIINGLLDRNVSRRIENFGKIATYFNSFFGSLPEFNPTWDSYHMQEQERNKLANFRCSVAKKDYNNVLADKQKIKQKYCKPQLYVSMPQKLITQKELSTSDSYVPRPRARSPRRKFVSTSFDDSDNDFVPFVQEFESPKYRTPRKTRAISPVRGQPKGTFQSLYDYFF